MNKEEFISYLKELNIEISEKKLNNLDKYYNLLITENKKYNLTAITNQEEVYLKHFYDSLTISKIINLSHQEICDIGTGAGFPGIVLKIMYPSIKLTLVESNKKKCNFLSKVVTTLQLNNVIIINERAEVYAKEVREKYDIVTSRAVAPLKHLLEYSIPLLKIKGNYIAMKANVEKEMEGIEKYYKILSITEDNVIRFKLPKEDSIRTLILYTKLDKTNPKFPRKYSEIKKKDL